MFRTVILSPRFVSFSDTLREKCPYSQLFWSENADQNKSDYEHFLRSDTCIFSQFISVYSPIHFHFARFGNICKI